MGVSRLTQNLLQRLDLLNAINCTAITCAIGTPREKQQVEGRSTGRPTARGEHRRIAPRLDDYRRRMRRNRS